MLGAGVLADTECASRICPSSSASTDENAPRARPGARPTRRRGRGLDPLARGLDPDQLDRVVVDEAREIPIAFETLTQAMTQRQRPLGCHGLLPRLVADHAAEVANGLG